MGEITRELCYCQLNILKKVVSEEEEAKDDSGRTLLPLPAVAKPR